MMRSSFTALDVSEWNAGIADAGRSRPCSHFDACITAIGSYAEAARQLRLKTAWGVQKWRTDGVPHDRVIPLSSLVNWTVTPHQLRPDLYPHPDDGLPPDMRGRAAA